jgi:hypothetical protein
MRTPNAGENFEGIMHTIEEGNHARLARETKRELEGKAQAEAAAGEIEYASPEPEILRDSRGRLYLAGPILRRLPEPQPALSKRERAKIKRLAKKTLTPARAAVHARVGAFFA